MYGALTVSSPSALRVLNPRLRAQKGVAKDAADMKEKGKRMAGVVMKWIKAHFDELQFYSLETYMQDGADYGDKHKDIQFAVNLAYVRYDNGVPYFYFIKDAFSEVSGSARPRLRCCGLYGLLTLALHGNRSTTPPLTSLPLSGPPPANSVQSKF